ncbi:MAG: putative membrane protein YadS, partial [Planctomycetota bacterium]
LRVVMLAPVVFILAFVLRRVRQGGDVQARRASLPWFVVLFVLAAGMRALGWVDAPLKVAAESRAVWGWLQIAGTFILSIALAAIGIGLDVKTLIRVGPRFLVAGTLAVTAMVAALVPLVHWFL